VHGIAESDPSLRGMGTTLTASAAPEEVTRRLIDLADEGGGPDNIICVVADVVDLNASADRP
jgi:serine/threonine protein phosphatase PrpC